MSLPTAVNRQPCPMKWRASAVSPVRMPGALPQPLMRVIASSMAATTAGWLGLPR